MLVDDPPPGVCIRSKLPKETRTLLYLLRRRIRPISRSSFSAAVAVSFPAWETSLRRAAGVESLIFSGVEDELDIVASADGYELPIC